ncbi:MAG: hypothetical protein JRD87_06775 [Deltaproteobacteria bacterium]|nr:hypothetical protein [Deltaproteobacteria bacterium]
MTNGDGSRLNFKGKKIPLKNAFHESDPGTPSNPNASAPPSDDILSSADASLRKDARKELDPNGAAFPQSKNQLIPSGSDSEEIEEEVGMTVSGRKASMALVALGRAARSFLLYEPDNQAVTSFLQDLRDKFYGFLDQYGEMVLDVRPWEMMMGSEVVYLNRDRERSLSFRLFRDGVRKVTITPDVQWNELTKFLGIISIRYTGIRQQEDDIVVMLWKAGFKHIVVESVEGFVPEDDDVDVDTTIYSDDDTADSALTLYAAAPDGFDIPWPVYNERASIRYVEMDSEHLRKLDEEVSNLTLPDQCVGLLKEILETAANPVEPMKLEEAIPMVQEVANFLSAEGLLSSLLEVMRVVQTLPFNQRDDEHRGELLRAFSDVNVLVRVIRSFPAGLQEVPPQLIELVEMVPEDPVPMLLEILNNERTRTARLVTRNLLVRMGSDKLDHLVKAIDQLKAPVAADLLRVVSDIDLDRGIRMGIDMGIEADVDLQLVALSLMERGPYSKRVSRYLINLLESSSMEVRMHALKLLVLNKEPSAFSNITRRLEHNAAGNEMDLHEVEALGSAMVTIREDRALEQFVEWIQPKKLLQRMLPRRQNLKWAAVTGLSQIPGDQAKKYIRLAAKTAGEELHRHCMKSLVLQRRLGMEVPDG